MGDPQHDEWHNDEFDNDDPDLECSWCEGEGVIEGKDPFWDEGEWVNCPSCHGSGLMKDMTLW